MDMGKKRMKRKLWGLLLAFAVLLTSVNIPAMEAGATEENDGYLYLDPTGMTEGDVDWTDPKQSVYLILIDSGWGTYTYKMEYDTQTGYWKYNIGQWEVNSDFCFTFAVSNDWDYIKAADYRRTSDSPATIKAVKEGRAESVYSWDSPNTEAIDSRRTYSLKAGAAVKTDDHTEFAGETMWLKNESGSEPGTVTAVFCEKDENGAYTEVSRTAMEDRGEGEYAVTIPSEPCSYVRFEDAQGYIMGDPYSNFYGEGSGEDGVESFRFSAGSACCYYYRGGVQNSSWGSRTVSRVYYNAALSRLSYTGDTTVNNSGKPIPYENGKVYCYITGEGKEPLKAQEMQQDAENSDLYYIDLQEGYTQIRFAGYQVSDESASANGDATALTEIPSNLSNPCYFGDSGDDVMYKGGNRGGYWAEAGSVGNAEKGKGTQVTDIPEKEFTEDQDKLYINTTLYDYYSDYELNGNNRDNYDGTTNVNSHRIYQQFRQFNQALSGYYKENQIANPIYWGNFQNYSGDLLFTNISDALNLFSFGPEISSRPDSDAYHKFFYLHHSMWGRNGQNFNESSVEDAKTGKVATQGIASEKMTGNTLALDTETEGQSVPAPFFDEEFLQGNNNKNTVLGKVYKNVSFPFVKKQLGSLSKGDDNAGTTYGTVDYWYYNSDIHELSDTVSGETIPENANLRLYYNEADGYFLDSAGTGDADGVKGEKPDNGGTATSENQYFPLNDTEQSGDATQLNYGFGQKFEITFRLTENGTVKTDQGYDVPIEFNFSGDDDVWVYVDGELVLDVGGGHGKVTGRIDFSAKKSYVSAVKNNDSTNGGATEGVTTEFPESLKGDPEFYQKEHTLTMFYMERGIWESNLRLSFNFPDENEFAVEKEVDDSEVNEIFREEKLGYDLFEDASVFPFVIQNQATHYAEKAADTGGNESVPVIYNDSFGDGTLEKPSSGNTVYDIVLEKTDWQGKDDTVHWRASYSDAGGGNKQKRWGIIKPENGGTLDASKADAYLRFSLYYDEDDTPTLNNMYIELEDKDGDKLYGELSGKIYGTSSLAKKTWNTVQVDLEKLNETGTFDFSAVKNIKFNYNFEKDIYLDDFTFIPSVITTGKTGFVTAQEDIPSYGSSESGHLEYPAGAVYDLTGSGGESKSYRIGTDGTFALADGETAVFRDQFRRGSYIALTEVIDQKLFETSWTMYENGVPVTALADGESVVLAEAMSDLEAVGSLTIKDGRQEVYQSGQNANNVDISNGGYRETGWAKNPDDSENTNTIVFRSYSDPDNQASLTKLKVKFTNKVKTGSIVIKKEAAEGSASLNGTYTFKVTYTNLAGMALEREPITETYTTNAGGKIRIDGIPAGTVYRIEEIGATDDSVLEDADFYSNNMKSDVGYDNASKTVEGKMVVFGTEEEGETVPEICRTEKAEAVVQFNNTLKPTIDILLEKLWSGTLEDVQYPKEIKVQLQRRTADTEPWSSVQYETGKDYVTVTPDYASGKWKYEFRALDRYSDYPYNTKPYQYRIVELDENNQVIESGGYLNKIFKVTYSDAISPETGNDSKDFTYSITNTYSPEGTVKIIKKSGGDNKFLSGAEFALYTDRDGKNIAKDSSSKELKGTTGENGEIIFRNIPAGTETEPKIYYLKEIKTAAGYVLLKDPIEVKLPYKYAAGDIVDGIEVEEDGVTWNLTYTIINDKAFDLPASGLKGIGPIIFAGAAVIAAAGTALAVKNKRARRRVPHRRRRRPH